MALRNSLTKDSTLRFDSAVDFFKRRYSFRTETHSSEMYAVVFLIILECEQGALLQGASVDGDNFGFLWERECKGQCKRPFRIFSTEESFLHDSTKFLQKS